MNTIGIGAAKLLSRLAINPALRQADLAKELGITRSAVNQQWAKLVKNNNLRICGNLDYGFVGMHLLSGWVIDSKFTSSIPKFIRWISNNPFVTRVIKSEVTSLDDSRVFFEALVPSGRSIHEFIRRLKIYKKSPYDLELHYSYVMEIGTYLNMGLLKNQKWQFDSGFKLQATIDGARPYADILPVSNAIYQTAPRVPDAETLAIISMLEQNYFGTWKDLTIIFERFGLSIPSPRTLRRRIAKYRESVLKPYIHIENIGLEKMVVVTLSAESSSDIYRLLRAQCMLFPKARVISGEKSIAIILDLPETSNWLYVSNTISNIVGSPTQMCTFIAEQLPERGWLENVAQYFVKRIE